MAATESPPRARMHKAVSRRSKPSFIPMTKRPAYQTRNQGLRLAGPYQWAQTLWKSDGSKQGTTVVKADLSKYSSVVFSVACNNMLFFALGQNGSSEFTLWRSDGTPEGTLAISDPLKGIGAPGVIPFAVHNNELYVVAKGDVFGDGNTMLFKMD